MTSSPGDEVLIARLLGMPAQERADWLERACATDPGLHDRLPEIAEVLAAAERVRAGKMPERVTDPVVLRALEFALNRPGKEVAGTSIGPYKLLQELGEGGFGVVWMAEQQEPIRRRVALKIIKIGMDTREVVARFEAERQALALMDHPNIARVFDAGATESGRPYFVMELVRGVAITRYCDENRLSTEARLRLFVAVCQAVQHAHHKGIIHRDLKPSNILVTLHDGMPVPKVIDFGIAKATASRLTEKTLFTQFHAFIGTPAYTSPEQVEMSGLDIDTRSDIYSLGVLLYELLAGRPPFDSEKLMKSGLEAMRRTIREVDPPRPSTRLDTLLPADRTTLARQRGIEAAKLALLLRGDLDWIVMRCLEKDRTRRYDSAAGLAGDVLHYLQDEPVVARPPSAGYRLGKYMRRHKLAFAAGTAVFASLVAGLVMLSLLLVRERESRQREAALRASADANANDARVAAAKSAQVAQFMKNMLSGVAPGVARSRDTTMLREILDATALKLDTELADQPQVAADLRDTLGTVYRDLGQFAVAEKLFREAVAARRKFNPSDSAGLATSLEYHGRVLGQLGRPECTDVLLEALAIRKRLFGDKHPLVVHTLARVAQLPASSSTTFEEWEALRRKVLAMRIEILGPEHPDVADSIFSLGTAAYQRNDLAESATLYRRSLDMRKKLLGDDHPVVVDSLISLGWTLREDGKWAEAEAAYREALPLAAKLMPEHPMVTTTLLRLVGGQPPVAHDDAVVALARAAFSAQRARLGPDAPGVAVSSLALAVLLDGRPETAVEVATLIGDAVAVLEANRARGVAPDPQISYDMSSCGSERVFAGAPAQAFALAQQALLSIRSGPPSSVSAPSSPLMVLAMANYYTGRNAEARAYWEEVIPLLQKTPGGAARPPTLPHLSLFAAANREAGRLAEAERVLVDGLAAMRQSLGNAALPDPSVAAMYCELGLTLNAQARFGEAEKYFHESIEHHDRAAREKSSRPMTRKWQQLRPRAETESGLGQALAGQRKFDEAEPLLLNAFSGLEAQRDKLGGDRTKLLREAAGRIVECYTAWGKTGQAAEWRKKQTEIPVAPEPRS